MTKRFSIAVLSIDEDAEKASTIASVIASQNIVSERFDCSRPLPKADAFVVCWSQAAARDSDFQSMAADLNRSKRIDVMLSRGLALSGSNLTDLSRWQGKPSSALLFPLRDQARIVASSRRWGWPAMRTLSKAVVGIGVVFGIVASWPATQSLFCRLPLVGPHICRPWGMGGLATPEQDDDYQRALAGGCTALKSLIRESPENPNIGRARELLESPREVQRGSWTKGVRTAEFYVVGDVSPSRALASSWTTNAARVRASEICQEFPQNRWRPSEIDVSLDTFDCRQASDGWRCDVRGRAICQGERYNEQIEEICGPSR